jgi:pyrroline-5-carboxylate reductase
MATGRKRGRSTRSRAASRIAFIGGGNMAAALVRGLTAVRTPASITVSEPEAAKRTALRRRFGITTVSSNGEAAARSDLVVLAVKPQIIDGVLAELAGAIDRKRHVVVSIAAGVKLARIETALGEGVRVVRVMPNTPSLVGRGVAVLCAGRHARRSDLSAAREIFAAVGQVHVVDDEASMDAVTGLSGSGPAYVYRFAEALTEGGRRCGLPERLAAELTYSTIAGAAEMMLKTKQPPGALREAVSSPGGTTLAGLAALEERGFFDDVVACVEAAVRRSRELGRS